MQVLINVVVGFLLEKMVIDNYNELPQVLKREEEQVQLHDTHDNTRTLQLHDF